MTDGRCEERQKSGNRVSELHGDQTQRGEKCFEAEQKGKTFIYSASTPKKHL